MKVRSIRWGTTIKLGEWVAYKFEVGVSGEDLENYPENPRYWIDDVPVGREAFEAARSITRG